MKFAFSGVGAARLRAIMSSSIVVGIVNHAIARAPTGNGRRSLRQPSNWTPSTARTDSGSVMPWKACSGDAPRAVPDRRKIPNAATGQARGAAATKAVRHDRRQQQRQDGQDDRPEGEAVLAGELCELPAEVGLPEDRVVEQ